MLFGARRAFWAAFGAALGFQVVPVYVAYWPIVGWRLR